MFLDLDPEKKGFAIPFYPALAAEIGVYPAIVLVQLNFWLRTERGRWYRKEYVVTHSIREMQRYAFKDAAVGSISKHLNKLAELGLINKIQAGKDQYHNLTQAGVDLLARVVGQPYFVQDMNDTVQKSNDIVQDMDDTVQNMDNTVQIVNTDKSIKDIKKDGQKETKESVASDSDDATQPSNLDETSIVQEKTSKTQPDSVTSNTPPPSSAPPPPRERSRKQRIIEAIAIELAHSSGRPNAAAYYAPQAAGVWANELKATDTSWEIDASNFEEFCKKWRETGLSFPRREGVLIKHYLWFRDNGELLTSNHSAPAPATKTPASGVKPASPTRDQSHIQKVKPVKKQEPNYE